MSVKVFITALHCLQVTGYQSYPDQIGIDVVSSPDDGATILKRFGAKTMNKYDVWDLNACVLLSDAIHIRLFERDEYMNNDVFSTQTQQFYPPGGRGGLRSGSDEDVTEPGQMVMLFNDHGGVYELHVSWVSPLAPVLRDVTSPTFAAWLQGFNDPEGLGVSGDIVAQLSATKQSLIDNWTLDQQVRTFQQAGGSELGVLSAAVFDNIAVESLMNGLATVVTGSFSLILFFAVSAAKVFGGSGMLGVAIGRSPSGTWTTCELGAVGVSAGIAAGMSAGLGVGVNKNPPQGCYGMTIDVELSAGSGVTLSYDPYMPASLQQILLTFGPQSEFSASVGIGYTYIFNCTRLAPVWSQM